MQKTRIWAGLLFHPGIGYHAYVYKGMKSNCPSERKTPTPTDGLDVSSQVWVCRDHSEGRHYLFWETWITTGLDTRG